jgi:glyoxylase-like metal-dependent hydrolase (beta-lactamase superfamily II)
VTLVCDAAGEALVGDTLFAGSIGRVDFPTSNPSHMHRSLHEVLMALPDTVRVHPGHGPSTSIGAERRSNPWLQGDGWAEDE